jgi:hypothetical protein
MRADGYTNLIFDRVKPLIVLAGLIGLGLGPGRFGNIHILKNRAFPTTAESAKERDSISNYEQTRLKAMDIVSVTLCERAMTISLKAT